MSEAPAVPEVPFTATTDFRHHKTSYEADQEYSAPATLVMYFINSGWATSEHLSPQGEVVVPSEVTLEVADIVQDQTSRTEN